MVRVLFFKVRILTNEPNKSKGNKDDDMMISYNIDQYSHSIYKHRLNLWGLYIDILCFLIFRGSTQIDETLWRLYMNIMCFS